MRGSASTLVLGVFVLFLLFKKNWGFQPSSFVVSFILKGGVDRRNRRCSCQLSYMSVHVKKIQTKRVFSAVIVMQTCKFAKIKLETISMVSLSCSAIYRWLPARIMFWFKF